MNSANMQITNDIVEIIGTYLDIFALNNLRFCCNQYYKLLETGCQNRNAKPCWLHIMVCNTDDTFINSYFTATLYLNDSLISNDNYRKIDDPETNMDHFVMKDNNVHLYVGKYWVISEYEWNKYLPLQIPNPNRFVCMSQWIMNPKYYYPEETIIIKEKTKQMQCGVYLSPNGHIVPLFLADNLYTFLPYRKGFNKYIHSERVHQDAIKYSSRVCVKHISCCRVIIIE